MRVVIGEDEALMREGLTLVLARAGVEVVGAAADADALLREVENLLPDMVITDIRMPPGNSDDGLRAALRIREVHPRTAILVLSQYVQRQYAVELLADRPTGTGYLLKQRIADIPGFCRDVHRIADGGTVLDPQVVTVMLARAAGDDGLGRLTPRQRTVLGLIAEGRSNAAIARELAIADKTVVQHTSQIYDQLGLPPSDDDHRRVLAVVRYLAASAP